MIRYQIAVALVLGIVSLKSAPAQAGRNDVDLSHFGSCTVSDASTCPGVRADDESFGLLARDLALALTPLSPTAAETLGVAGYSISIVQGFHGADTSQPYWDAAENATSSLTSTHLVVRKGLPFSIDIGTNFGTLWDSDLMSIGGDLRWSLHEDFLWPAPDLSVRGFASTTINHAHLNLTTAGVEVMTGIHFGVGNSVNITPFAGYNATFIIANTRIIDADPQVNRPVGGGYNSELTLDNGTEAVHRGLFGVRVQFAFAELAWEGAVSSVMFQNALMLGASF